jgi:23S rRNA (guanine2445-N2)-methyltransferase / 23S rRNA (guanine2069-N7)-methyltransferase
MLVTNPPYGERLEDELTLIETYQTLGKKLAALPDGFSAGIISSSQELAKSIGLRSHKQYTFSNGPLDCKLYLFSLGSNNQFIDIHNKPLSENQQMLFNRLKKNQKSLSSWIDKNNIHAYRLYDADLPEYNVAIDSYNDEVVIQEYLAPKTIEQEKVKQRLQDVVAACAKFFTKKPQQLILKQRARQKGHKQYEKRESTGERLVIKEGNIKTSVNLLDYLDTGLFLDHRLLRTQFEKLHIKRFLNLFCYTGVASLHAAQGGAITTNVDLSHTYLNWAKDNFRLNHFTINQHQFIKADCMQWLKEAVNNNNEKYEVIFLDPPSFSNSKRMSNVLDIQRDHVVLIQQAMQLLTPKGVLYFSTNLKSFKLDESLKSDFTVKDLTHETTDLDFKKSKIKRQCFALHV